MSKGKGRRFSPRRRKSRGPEPKLKDLEGEHHMTEHRGPVCDFCLRPNPRWSFDGPNPHAGELQDVEGHAVLIGDNGVWSACTRCSNLVMRGSVERLAEVAAEGAVTLGNLPLSPLEFAEYTLELRKLYEITLPKLGLRRARNKKERNSEGGFVIDPIQDPKTN